MTRYSALSLIRQGFAGHNGWPRVWRDATPRSGYDIVIIGGGGHGLATAYYLARNHGLTNIAVLEKGGLGGGNVGRNTTIVRSNYLLDENAAFYEHGMKLWTRLSRDLNFNVMLSQRGVLNLAHTDAQMEAFARRGNAMRLNGIDAELLDVAAVQQAAPLLDTSPDARFPIVGGLIQPRAGTARHDAVAWGYARAADALGVDIIQNCEVTAIRRDRSGAVLGVETTRGLIGAEKIGLCVAGHTSQLAAMVDLPLPLESHLLQAMVTEPVKPCLDTVVTSGAAHCYISQTDKGELVFGGDLDGYPSFAQRGETPRIEHICASAVALFPAFSRLRLMRTWGGVVDMSMDGSPIIDRTPVPGLYLNGGWNYGGFKATPAAGWCFAHTIAHDAPHPLVRPFALDRFARGATLDEKGAGPTPALH
ncbi:sarcosine oxidase subunit beta family protein [Roseospira marina]|uniref:Sarcosine oxidase subunit beta family protein n=1 Tax=Roseospira marina TaxID=140057 RepID=A0A5M6IDA4_9PROT|nr:sarcosine oxidase subunit beta family protein [Roseospira marina]KAA5606260.1 sarcosine oxidase subunit beta family protein [Roseospira marina]MBB4314416.1 sarcosine oxidase subunit beta [Roseospira marina]MBB5087576.1 sarcosine oxidase subunit beta [Roseospira marina]